MINWFGYFKALHLIFMVCWFAGLFYMVRLFVYFSESDNAHGNNAKIFKIQYLLMQKRLWYIISWPSMILTLIFGGLMLYINPAYLSMFYMQIKLVFVTLLIIYHFLCHLIYLKQKKFNSNFSSLTMRIWNEVSTLFLIAIVFVVVLKNELDGFYGLMGFFVISLILFLFIKWYRRIRNQ